MILSFKEIHDGRNGGDTLDKKRGVRTHSRRWRAQTSTAWDDDMTILAAMPLLGSPHPSDMWAFCNSRKVDSENKSKRLWLATATYSTDSVLDTNPLNDPAEYEWQTASVNKPQFYDKDGNAILNSAGDFFASPCVEAEEPYWVCTVKKNLGFVPTWLLEYRGAINDAAFQMDGVDIAEQCARLTNIRIDKWQTRNDIRFRPITFTIGVRSNELFKPQVPPLESVYDDWRFYVLDRGPAVKCEIHDSPNFEKMIPAFLHDGMPKSICNLDGNGFALPEGAGPNENCFMTFHVYPEKDFSVLPIF